MRKALFLLVFGLSLAANVVLAVVLVIVVRDETAPGPTGPAVSIEAPRLPESLDRDSVTAFLDELGFYFDNQDCISSDDPAGVQIRFLWPAYALELVEGAERHTSLSMFLTEAVDSCWFPVVDTDVLFRYLGAGVYISSQEEIIRELLVRGEEQRLHDYVANRLERAASSELGGQQFVQKSLVAYALEAGIPVTDETIVGLLRCSSYAAMPLVRHMLRTDAARARRLVDQVFSSPHQLENLSHDASALVLLAETGFAAAIPLAAQAALLDQYEQTFVAVATRVLVQGTPPELSGPEYLSWLAAAQVESFIYDPATRRYEWSGERTLH
jgi:hypothetical protein